MKKALLLISFILPITIFAQNVINPSFGTTLPKLPQSNTQNQTQPAQPSPTQNQAIPVSAPAVVEQKATVVPSQTTNPQTQPITSPQSTQPTSSTPKLTIKNKLNYLVWIVTAPSDSNAPSDVGNAISLEPNGDATVDTPNMAFAKQVAINDSQSTEIDCKDLPGNQAYVITLQNNNNNQPVCNVETK